MLWKYNSTLVVSKSDDAFTKLLFFWNQNLIHMFPSS